MKDRVMPRYPIYIPSKGRYEAGQTMKFLSTDGVPFWLVVEPQEADEYGSRYGYDRLLILPWSGDDDVRRAFCAERGIENGGLIAVRNWIKEHSISNGDIRHWQVDDNIRGFYRFYSGKRIRSRSGIALRVGEVFADRYENVAIAGFAYAMFTFSGKSSKDPPVFFRNSHVYSCSLVLNAIPNRWRIAYNDDTDICLQVLADGWCTVQISAYVIEKIRTEKIKGGNTDDLYRGDGRLRMARSLERMWPGVVQTTRKYGRPQHHIKANWRYFDSPLIPKAGLDLPAGPDEYGMRLIMKEPVRSPRLEQIFEEFNRKVGVIE